MHILVRKKIVYQLICQMVQKEKKKCDYSSIFSNLIFNFIYKISSIFNFSYEIKLSELIFFSENLFFLLHPVR